MSSFYINIGLKTYFELR